MTKSNILASEPPIKWEELNIKFRHSHHVDNEALSNDYECRARAFLDKFEKTEQGQETLLGIQNNCESVTIELFEGHEGEAHHLQFGDSEKGKGIVYINTDRKNSSGFIDQKSCVPIQFPFERTLLHELTHLSDPRMAMDDKHLNEFCQEVLIEEYATTKTDEYATKYAPEFGIRGSYDNSIAPPKEGESLKTILENDPDLEFWIQDAINDVKVLIQACTGENKILNGNSFPIAKEMNSTNSTQQTEPVIGVVTNLSKISLEQTDTIKANNVTPKLTETQQKVQTRFQ